jgi:hypothetical protein
VTQNFVREGGGVGYIDAREKVLECRPEKELMERRSVINIPLGIHVAQI